MNYFQQEAQEVDGQFLLRRDRDDIFANKATGVANSSEAYTLQGYVAGIDPLSAVVFVAIGLAVYGIMVILRQF